MFAFQAFKAGWPPRTAGIFMAGFSLLTVIAIVCGEEFKKRGCWRGGGLLFARVMTDPVPHL